MRNNIHKISKFLLLLGALSNVLSNETGSSPLTYEDQRTSAYESVIGHHDLLRQHNIKRRIERLPSKLQSLLIKQKKTKLPKTKSTKKPKKPKDARTLKKSTKKPKMKKTARRVLKQST